jgi:hypothetical protein
MLVMRFFAGPIVHNLSPLGLLAISALLAILGLSYLSFAQGAAIFIAATLYGFGKTFFWPTMLGVVSEQCPRGGALTLNAISGIGMLAVGTLGFPYIGTLQTKAQQNAIVADKELQAKLPGLVENGKVVPVTERRIYEVIPYKVIDDAAVKELTSKLSPADAAAATKELGETKSRSNQRALLDMAMFPTFMLICYGILIVYFRSKGGYKPVDLPHVSPDEAADEY